MAEKAIIRALSGVKGGQLCRSAIRPRPNPRKKASRTLGKGLAVQTPKFLKNFRKKGTASDRGE